MSATNSELRPTVSGDFGIRARKRAFDLVLATLLLVIFAPLMLAAATLIRLTSKGPALFCQTRIGRDERPFTMFKFRTMYVGLGDEQHREFTTREILGECGCLTKDGIFRLVDDPRITPVGRLFRRFSIDELPQLFNVLRGEMSLVGPRPSLPWEVALYTAEQRQRHLCLPGLTGLWQVSGRNRLSIPEMLALDVAYARSNSLRTDLWILLRTPYAALFGRDTR